jgi:cytochrome c-type biogenesis protein CcmH
MMMLWFALAALTLVITLILVYPILRMTNAEPAARIDYDLAVYRDQLAEIDREIARGLLTEEQALAARAEVHRRMLAAEDAGTGVSRGPEAVAGRRLRLRAVVAIAVVVPVGALAVYDLLGSPSLPGAPYAWRLKHDPDFVAAAQAASLDAQLKNSPSAAGYKRLAETYFAARNYEQAAAADRRAVELGANDASSWSDLGEAVVMSNGGTIVPEALMAFVNALDRNARDERARFYVGLAEAQIGNLRHAVAIWRDMERDADPNASFLPLVQQHVDALSKQGGFDPASVPPSPPDTASLKAAVQAMAGALHTRSESSGDNASAPPPSSDDAQQTMIHNMVARLAARMTQNPEDADGWQRLARAYTVLGERDKARDAIVHAARLKPDDVDLQLMLADIEKAAAAPGDDTPADFIATLRNVLRRDPDNEKALYFVGLSELNSGHPAIARAMWKKALARAGGNDDVLATSIRNRLDALSRQ